MSSESISFQDADAYKWKTDLDINDYILVSYYAESIHSIESIAIAIAREQSATNIRIRDLDEFLNIRKSTARVYSTKSLGKGSNIIMPAYNLSSSTYRDFTSDSNNLESFEFQIAFPIINFNFELSNLWNAIGGEIHRIGIINTIRVIDINFPEKYTSSFKGPRFGINGLRRLLKIYDRPLLCRSTRPAVGLSNEDVIGVNRKILLGGFDIIKDDELTCNTKYAPFKNRIESMSNMIKDVENITGQKKLYFCNITASPKKTFEYAEIAVKSGASGFLVCPAIQGFEICKDISEEFNLPILSHNSWFDVLTRHPKYGVTDTVILKLLRLSGADLLMLPGNFATETLNQEYQNHMINACNDSMGDIKKSLPIMAGGKNHNEIRKYSKAVGSSDYMMIIATSIDNNVKGLENGAKEFLTALKDEKK